MIIEFLSFTTPSILKKNDPYLALLRLEVRFFPFYINKYLLCVRIYIKGKICCQ